MRTSASNSGRGLKISLAICLPSNNQSWRDEVASPRPKHNRGDADRYGKLGPRQKTIAEKADLIIRTLAHIGIIALIDEATGYQEVRDRQALQEILDKYLRKEFAAWAKCFPEEFYKQIFRLRQWQWRGMKVNRPQIVAYYTKDLIYARLAPGILTEL